MLLYTQQCLLSLELVERKDFYYHHQWHLDNISSQDLHRCRELSQYIFQIAELVWSKDKNERSEVIKKKCSILAFLPAAVGFLCLWMEFHIPKDVAVLVTDTVSTLSFSIQYGTYYMIPMKTLIWLISYSHFICFIWYGPYDISAI